MAEYDICHIKKSTMKAIANSVRAKTGKTDLIPGENISTEIDSIITAGNVPTGVIDITENGEHNVKDYAVAKVSVPNTIPDGYVKPSETIEITENGEYDVATFANANVKIPIPEPVEEWDPTDFTIFAIITFVINARTLRASKGSTWGEWVADTMFNTDGFFAHCDNVSTYDQDPLNYLVCSEENVPVTLDEPIIADKVYIVGSVSNELTFSIGSITYHAEPDTKWADWLVTDYNSDPDVPVVQVGDWISANNMQHSHALYTSDGVLVRVDEAIIDDHAYVLKDISEVTTTFSVGSNSYTANMCDTWINWIKTDNNDPTVPFVEVGNWISVNTMAASHAMYNSDGVLVKASDYILPEHKYTFKEVSGMTINFSVGNLDLVANLTDTWDTWLISENNTNNFVKTYNRIGMVTIPDSIVFDADGNPADAESYILADGKYTLDTVENAPNTITFYIDDVSFTALPGDKWNYWITTSYNEYGLTIHETNGRVMNKAGSGYMYDANGYYVNATDSIRAGHRYSFSAT